MKFIIALALLISNSAMAGEDYPNIRVISQENGWKKTTTFKEGVKKETWVFTNDEKLMQASDLNDDGVVDYLRLQKPRDSFHHYVWTDTDYDGFFDKRVGGKLKAKIKVPELSRSAYGLVLLVDFKEPGHPSNTIRVTLENRSKKPIKVIPPADIKRPWGEGGWWYCGSYQFYLHSATLGLVKYACDTPRPPAIFPRPVPPELVTLLPGQSIGGLLDLPLPVPVDASKISAPDEPPLPTPLFWKKADSEGTGKPPRSGYTLAVKYSPVEYQSAVVLYPIGSEKNNGKDTILELVPPTGKKITSNSLLFDVKKPQPREK